VFHIVAKKWLWFGISLVLIVPGIVFLFLGGLKPGIDFTGGSQLEVSVGQAPNTVEALQTQAASEKLNLKSIVPAANNHYLLRFQSLTQAQQTNYVKHLNDGLAKTEVISFTSVGPTISGAFSWKSVVYGIALPLRFAGVNIPSDNISQALGGVFWASVAITLYIAYAFRKVPKPYSPWAFGVSAIVSLLHDALLILGLFAILGYFFDIEIDTSFVTAVLTVIGFSVHDTIVVFDRVRENLHRHPEMDFSQVVDVSVMETLDRSISTSLTVVFVLAALFLFGGDSIRWFVFALLVGIISGTYSSIFNASMVLAVWEDRRLKQHIASKKTKVDRSVAKKAKVEAAV
jgi:preprotein translocase subunit SecF